MLILMNRLKHHLLNVFLKSIKPNLIDYLMKVKMYNQLLHIRKMAYLSILIINKILPFYNHFFIDKGMINCNILCEDLIYFFSINGFSIRLLLYHEFSIVDKNKNKQKLMVKDILQKDDESDV